MTSRTLGGLRPLAELLRVLREWAEQEGYDPSPLNNVGYRNTLDGVIAGRFPAERINNRWFFDPAKLEPIAKAFGLMREREPAPGPVPAGSASERRSSPDLAPAA